MGSLGFNPNRRHRSSNLPGALNTMVVRAQTRVPNQRRAQTPKEIAVLVPRMTSPQMPIHSIPSLPPVQTPIDTPSSHPLNVEEMHWVYATVGTHHLHDSNDLNDIVCVKDSRVLLVYPMVADPDTGIVSMKVKHVDAHTGQLEMRWVDVYDPNTDTRFVSQFSMVP